MSTENRFQLVRALTLRDLVLFNIVAVTSLTTLTTSAKLGMSALTLWLLAAVFFFIPQGLAVIELSSRFPDEGGIYSWTKLAFGEGHGFLCGWCYWINNVLFYPTVLLSAAVVSTYAIGQGESGLRDNWIYLLTFTFCGISLAVVLNIVGVGTGKWLQNIGGASMFVPGIILIALGVYGVFTKPSANPITVEQFRPGITNLSALNLWATVAFGYAGLELSSTMGREIQNPSRNLPNSIYISAPVIACIYILGIGSLLWFVPEHEVNIITGPFQAVSAGVRNHLGSLWWLVPLAAVASTIGRIGGVGAWLVGPARVAFVIGLDRYFPPAFGRVHPRWRTPYVAILVQGVLALIFLLISVLGKGMKVEAAFLILLDTSLLIYFIPYVYLFICFLSHCRRARAQNHVLKVPGGWSGALLIGLSGLFVTLFSMAATLVPPPDTPNPWVFEAKVIGGTIFFVMLGVVNYWRAKRVQMRSTSNQSV